MLQSEKKLIAFVAIGCMVLAILGYSWKQRTSIPFVTVPLETIVTPFSYGVARSLDGVHTGIAVIDAAISKAVSTSQLEEENTTLSQKVVDYDEVVAENERLKALLDYKVSHPAFAMTMARVVTRDMGTWTQTFTIDRGSADGIAVNMAVIVPSGVVGYVTDVYPHSARVQTVLDPRTSIGVIVQRKESRLAGVMKGNGSNPDSPTMVDVARDGDILAGDLLVTSGYGGIYPKGLPVGTVDNLENDPEGFVKNASVMPAVNFHRLEEVFVITTSAVGADVKPNLEPKLMPQTQRDQVQGVKGAGKQ